MERYTIYCTEEQTKKALELGAPLEQVYYNVVTKDALARYNLVLIGGKEYKIPTAEEMIGWLEEQESILAIEIDRDNTNEVWMYLVYTDNKEVDEWKSLFFSRKEATLAAIDAALEYLSSHNPVVID